MRTRVRSSFTAGVHGTLTSKDHSGDPNPGVFLCADLSVLPFTYAPLWSMPRHTARPVGKGLGSPASPGSILSPLPLVPICGSGWSPTALALGKQRAVYPKIHSKTVLLGASNSFQQLVCSMGDWSRAASDIYKAGCVGASTRMGACAHSWCVYTQGREGLSETLKNRGWGHTGEVEQEEWF